MEIINNFGIDPKLLIAQVVNFLIILFVLKRFLYKPVLDLLEQRKKIIEEGVQKTEEARLLLEKAEAKEKELLKEAVVEAKKLLEEAKNQKIELLRESEEKAKKQADLILAEAKDQIAFETKQAEKRLKIHVSEIALFFLQKSLTGLLTGKQQEEVIKNVAQKLKKQSN